MGRPALIPPELREQLLKSGRRRADDPPPLLKLFAMPAATWLICELAEDGDTMFGLCDLGMGKPELGYVSLDEIAHVAERDEWWKSAGPISAYATAARAAGRIVDHLDTPWSATVAVALGAPMTHRNLDIPGDSRTVAAIHSILERGKDPDIYRLMMDLRRDPFSEAADNALAAARESTVYGYPALIVGLIDRWRKEGPG